jgi:hypothetical protein
LVFALARGGPFFRLLRGARLTGSSAPAVLRGGLALVVVTWLPLLIASFFEGYAFTKGGFLSDIGVHARMDLAVPLLLLGERAADRRLGRAVRYLERAGLIDEGNRPAAAAAIARVHRARDAAWPEVVFVGVVLAASVFQGNLMRPGAPWMLAEAGARLSAAGLWYFAVSVSIYRFLLLRWLEHIVLWTTLLVGLARAPLRLVPGHPDRMGGLAVIAGAHQSFGWPVLALGASLAGYLTTMVRLSHRPVTDFAYEVGVFVVLAPLVFLAPLFVFSVPLEALRRRVCEEYGAAAASFTRRYHARWLRPGSEVIPLGSPDPSSDTDLGTSFERSVGVSRIPFRKQDAVFLFGCAAFPMLLFFVQGMPLIEIFETLRKIFG